RWFESAPRHHPPSVPIRSAPTPAQALESSVAATAGEGSRFAGRSPGRSLVGFGVRPSGGARRRRYVTAWQRFLNWCQDCGRGFLQDRGSVERLLHCGAENPDGSRFLRGGAAEKMLRRNIGTCAEWRVCARRASRLLTLE